MKNQPRTTRPLVNALSGLNLKPYCALCFKSYEQSELHEVTVSKTQHPAVCEHCMCVMHNAHAELVDKRTNEYDKQTEQTELFEQQKELTKWKITENKSTV